MKENEKNHQQRPHGVKRKIVKVGPSNYINTPKQWTELNNLKTGDTVEIFINQIFVAVPLNIPPAKVRKILDAMYVGE